MIFIIELVAFRWGTAKLAALGIAHDPHGHGISHDPNVHGIGAHAAHGPELEKARGRSESPSSSDQEITIVEKEKDIEAALATSKDIPHNHDHGHSHSHGVVEETAASQIVGIAILEFGVVLHR